MAKEHVVLCGGVATDEKRTQTKPLELRLGKEQDRGEIRLDIGAITKKMMANLPHVLHDLLEVATYVYVADQATSRGRTNSFDYGHSWHRIFRFRIPVREQPRWSDPAVKELLEDTLSFASGDTYSFEFVPQESKKYPEYLMYRTESDPNTEYNAVVLFSGGLDSFTGAIDEWLGQGNLPVLVGHVSNPKVASLQDRLRKYMEGLKRPGPSPLHVPIRINKIKELTHDKTQRTRSFLYASLGTIIARMFGLDRVKFYENGIVSCNLPFDGQAPQARLTRSTHPKLLHLLSSFISTLIGPEFHFENPYFGRTKTEVCLRLKELHQETQIQETRSCAQSIFQRPRTHCGTCSQCLDRRFATLASECQDYDPEWTYALNVFTESIDRTPDRAMATGLVGSARRWGGMSRDGFVERFSSEVYEIAKYIGTDNTETGLNALFRLHQSHSKSVMKVMARQIEEQSCALALRKLPPTCLLRMDLTEQDIVARKEAKRPGKEKHGKGKLNPEVKRLLELHPKWNAVRIAEEIRNTTPGAVRKTNAWKQRPK